MKYALDRRLFRDPSSVFALCDETAGIVWPVRSVPQNSRTIFRSDPEAGQGTARRQPLGLRNSDEATSAPTTCERALWG
jgi:hypothetical protein